LFKKSILNIKHKRCLMNKIYLASCSLLISLTAGGAHAETIPSDAAGKRRACATLGLAFRDSVVITEDIIHSLSAGGGAPFPSMLASVKKTSDMANTLEQRYGKTAGPEKIADAKAMSEKPLKPMWDMSEQCLQP
jgi:hypothetical protein